MSKRPQAIESPALIRLLGTPSGRHQAPGPAGGMKKLSQAMAGLAGRIVITGNRETRSHPRTRTLPGAHRRDGSAGASFFHG